MKSTRTNLRIIQHTQNELAPKQNNEKEENDRTCMKRFPKNSIYYENETKSIDKICLFRLCFAATDACEVLTEWKYTIYLKCYCRAGTILRCFFNLLCCHIISTIKFPNIMDYADDGTTNCEKRNTEKKRKRKQKYKKQSSIITNFAHESFR